METPINKKDMFAEVRIRQENGEKEIVVSGNLGLQIELLGVTMAQLTIANRICPNAALGLFSNSYHQALEEYVAEEKKKRKEQCESEENTPDSNDEKPEAPEGEDTEAGESENKPDKFAFMLMSMFDDGEGEIEVAGNVAKQLELVSIFLAETISQFPEELAEALYYIYIAVIDRLRKRDEAFADKVEEDFVNKFVKLYSNDESEDNEDSEPNADESGENIPDEKGDS